MAINGSTPLRTRAVFLDWTESWLGASLLDGVSLLDAAGFRFFVVAPVGARELENRLGQLFRAIGVPHPGFCGGVENAVAESGIKLEESWVIGSDPDRVEASRRRGGRAILVGPRGVGSFQIAVLRIISGLDELEIPC